MDEKSPLLLVNVPECSGDPQAISSPTHLDTAALVWPAPRGTCYKYGSVVTMRSWIRKAGDQPSCTLPTKMRWSQNDNWYWWLCATLWYLQCISTGDTSLALTHVDGACAKPQWSLCDKAVLLWNKTMIITLINVMMGQTKFNLKLTSSAPLISLINILFHVISVWPGQCFKQLWINDSCISGKCNLRLS